MAGITGGDLKEVTWKNTDVGGGRYFSKAGETHTVDLGGLATADDASNIDTGGNFMGIMQTKPWSYEATIAWDMNNVKRRELETYQALTQSLNETAWTFQNINGKVYVGSGRVVGDVKGDAKACTISFKVMGSGILQAVN